MSQMKRLQDYLVQRVQGNGFEVLEDLCKMAGVETVRIALNAIQDSMLAKNVKLFTPDGQYIASVFDLVAPIDLEQGDEIYYDLTSGVIDRIVRNGRVIFGKGANADIADRKAV